MSSNDDTHEPDDSEQISLDLLNFVIPEIEGSYTFDHVLIADAEVGLTTGQPAVRSTKLTRRPSVTSLSARVAVPWQI